VKEADPPVEESREQATTGTPDRGRGPAPSARLLLENVKFEHTIFALPFAYIGMVLAAQGLPTLWQVVWITVAMAAARTFAMSLNRLIDRQIDRRNPRTRGRPLPSGRLSPSQVVAVAAVSLAVLVLAAWLLTDLTLRLFPIALAFLVGYHYTKRFSWLSHYVLGITDAAAPMGAWIAVTNGMDPPAYLLGLAVATWIGGFDVIYACQDVEVDRAQGLHSIPARFGIATALWVARLSHVVTVVALVATGILLGLGPLYYLGCLVATALLAYEHSLVRPDDLSRLNMAFFNVNGYLSVAVFLFALADVLVR
jgi:4-hydroxybenzoate polyprenyltransferase